MVKLIELNESFVLTGYGFRNSKRENSYGRPKNRYPQGATFAVLFRSAGSVGRTDFPGGSWEQLEASIRTQVYTLPDDTRLLSGHGPETTVGEEKRSNPFVQG